MKMHWFLVATLTVSTAVSSAFGASQDNQQELARLLASRTANVWQCKKGNNTDAVLIFKVSQAAEGIRSSSEIFAIQDDQICSALHINCPYVGSVQEHSFVPVGPALYQYWSTLGKYEDTVVFFSSSGGMKLVNVFNGSEPRADWDHTWYFNAGECVLN